MSLPFCTDVLRGHLPLKAYYWQTIISALYKVKINLTVDLCTFVMKLFMFQPKAYDSSHHSKVIALKCFVSIYFVYGVPLWILCQVMLLSLSSTFPEFRVCEDMLLSFRLQASFNITKILHTLYSFSYYSHTAAVAMLKCFLTGSDHILMVRGCMLYRLHWIHFQEYWSTGEELAPIFQSNILNNSIDLLMYQ